MLLMEVVSVAVLRCLPAPDLHALELGPGGGLSPLERATTLTLRSVLPSSYSTSGADLEEEIETRFESLDYLSSVFRHELVAKS